LCTLYDSYLATILTPEWIRIIVGSGLSDGVIPARYFALLQKRLLPKIVRETRKAFGNRSCARATVREQALLMGLHGGLVYSLGIWPYVYGQSFDGQGDPAMIAQIIRDRVQRSEERRVGKECRSRRAPDSQYINEGKR